MLKEVASGTLSITKAAGLALAVAAAGCGATPAPGDDPAAPHAVASPVPPTSVTPAPETQVPYNLQVTACLADFASDDVNARIAAMRKIETIPLMGLVAQLREVRRDARGGVRLCAGIAARRIEAGNQEFRLRQLGDIRVDLDVRDAELFELLRYLLETGGCCGSLTVDGPATARVALTVKHATFEDVLDRLCDDHDMTWTVTADGLRLAMKDAAAPEEDGPSPVETALPPPAESVDSRIAACIADFRNDRAEVRAAAIEALQAVVDRGHYWDVALALGRASRECRGRVRVCADIARHRIEAKIMEETMVRLTERKVTVDLRDAGLGEVVDFVREVAQVNIASRSDILPEPRVSLKLQDVSVERVLDRLCADHEFTWEVGEGCIVVRPSGEVGGPD